MEKRRSRRLRGSTRLGVVRWMGRDGGVHAATSAAAARRLTELSSTCRARTARSSGAAAHSTSHASMMGMVVSGRGRVGHESVVVLYHHTLYRCMEGSLVRRNMKFTYFFVALL